MNGPAHRLKEALSGLVPEVTYAYGREPKVLKESGSSYEHSAKLNRLKSGLLTKVCPVVDHARHLDITSIPIVRYSP